MELTELSQFLGNYIAKETANLVKKKKKRSLKCIRHKATLEPQHLHHQEASCEIYLHISKEGLI